MAEARVYAKWANQSRWTGPLGSGRSQQKDGNTALAHAERQAWKEAWNVDQVRHVSPLKTWIQQTQGQALGETLEVKIWVDQQVCGECQLWMMVVVPRNLGQLSCPVKLFVEVRGYGTTQSMEVTRDAFWPVTLGNLPTLAILRKTVSLTDD